METLAKDQFERYYAEKLWEMIPPIYRHEDGKEENPEKDVLRSIIEVMAEQAAVLRRSQDKLWDDQFVELCDSWAIPYLADLLGTRALSDQNKRGRRVDVAKTIYYRRRAGTPRVLEELISDITGWEGKVVENFQRLGRARHGLDLQPQYSIGRFSGTMPGGWADLRRPVVSELTGGPFDEFFHTPDFRQHRGHNGRYNIPKLAIHLYRLPAFYVEDSTPFSLEDGQRFLFDPSGRDIQLFSKRSRPEDWEDWHSALEWELPAPIRCRLLGHAEYLISESAIQALEENALISSEAIQELEGLGVQKLKDEQQLRALIATLPSHMQLELIWPSLLQYFMVKDCGKQFLLPNALIKDENGQIDPRHGSLCVKLPPPDQVITSNNIIAANLNNWAPMPADLPDFIIRVFGEYRHLAIDPDHGRFMFDVDRGTTPVCSYHYGFPGRIGAGTYDRGHIDQTVRANIPRKSGGGNLADADVSMDGVSQIDDSKTYGPVVDRAQIQNMTLQAANGHRPYLQLNRNWVLTGIKSKDSSAFLCLDGLWVGSKPNEVYGIILQGDYECVNIRNCTFDPGGDKNARSQYINPVPIYIEGHIDTLIIESSILGPLLLGEGGIVEKVCISDSILQSSGRAIDMHSGMVEISRSTVLGEVSVHRLAASEVLFFCLPPHSNATPKITVADNQSGCFRFSAAPQGSHLPQQYESYLYSNSYNGWFTSVRFGDPGYCQLSEIAPEQISRGAENALEIGAFNHLINPVKLDDLKTKIEEYMPFGLIPIFINET